MPKGKVLSESTQKIIHNMHARGKPTSEIAGDVGRSRNAVIDVIQSEVYIFHPIEFAMISKIIISIISFAFVYLALRIYTSKDKKFGPKPKLTTKKLISTVP